ncbi:uncharacterized protein YybS (DUF2232 family) [Desulfoprunum benzoelyticum]|uniref:Uncharacterized protein YybS (DUF2232 family) n=1 Tax=Desulfoprunum benzoelyticum TaxID=1506996 RepID=A0A840UKY4_9BACT|nr:uncharacterized protein YybS (DUF2232 family) [Desulfoprunum benzoelyticum]
MASEEQAGPELGKVFRNIFLLFLAAFLPALNFSVFGWLNGVLPLLAFMLLYIFGLNVGNKMILTGGLLAVVAGLALARMEPLLISFSMIPSGYAITWSARRQDSPARAGLKGIAVLGGCWLLLIAVFAAIYGMNPYVEFLQALDQGIAEALVYYRQSDTVPADTLLILETSLYQIKRILPLIMPSILTGIVLLTIWFTLAAGNRMAYQFTGNSPWPRYRLWKIPDRLIWLMIVAALAALVPSGRLQIVGINALIIGGILYCLQGLAVFSFFLHRWNLPMLLRSFLYVMVVFQSFGTILLVGTGLADVWLDLRKIRKPADTESADT